MKYEILLVSQFTLYHKMKGNKPSFNSAMDGPLAHEMYLQMLDTCKKMYAQDKIFPGAFGQLMEVEIIGDGPVTIDLESVEDLKAK